MCRFAISFLLQNIVPEKEQETDVFVLVMCQTLTVNYDVCVMGDCILPPQHCVSYPNFPVI
jgi:hypothetical protein